MHQNQATLFETLNQAVDAGTSNRKSAVPAGSRRKRTADPREREYLEKYVPVYHIELVRDRVIEAAERPSIHNSDTVVAILRDELLKADREKLVCLMLNVKNAVIGIDIISVGTLTASLASPRLCAAAHKRPYVSSPVMFRPRKLPGKLVLILHGTTT